MAYLSDIQIAQACEKRPITEIAKKAHIDEKYIELYGRWKAKVDPALLKEANEKLAAMAKKETTETLNKVLLDASKNMRCGYSRADN